MFYNERGEPKWQILFHLAYRFLTDESVYGPAGAGTVPMLFIATGGDKTDPTGTETDGIAKYTKSANSNTPVLVINVNLHSILVMFLLDRYLAQSQGDETNEYGLMAPYSFPQGLHPSSIL